MYNWGAKTIINFSIHYLLYYMKEFNMFKKTLLALSVSMMTASAAQAATVYNNDNTSLNLGGRVQSNINSVFAAYDFDETDQHKVKVEGSARLNVDAKTRIYDGVNAAAFAEWQVASESSENGKFDTRYATVGFETDHFGSLKFGQTESALYNVLGVTDVYEDIFFSANTLGAYADGGRQEGQIIYSIEDLNGFSFGATYQSAGLRGVKSGAAFSLGYTFNQESLPIFLGAGYDTYNTEETEAQNEDLVGLSSSLSRDSFGFGLSVGEIGDGFYGAAGYQLSKYAKRNGYKLNDVNSYEVVAGYGIEGWQFLLGYENAQFGGETVVNDIDLEIKYNFNDQFLVYADALLAPTNHTENRTVPDYVRFKDKAHDLLTVGVQYNF